MQVEVNVINAFSVDGTGGNPAGVVFNADQYSDAQKQAIAATAGFPETAFVSPSAMAGFKLDFFTPVKRIAHCGHATIATFSYMKQLGLVNGNSSSKETVDGVRAIAFLNNMAYMEQKAPVITAVEDRKAAILASLNINESALSDGLQPAVVNTGNSFLIVPIRDEETLRQVNYNREMVSDISAELGLIGYYLYVRGGAGIDATTRMFAPFYGIDEEAGTGMAAGPLAAYLQQVEKVDKTKFRIRQGDFMTPASGSMIYVELKMDGTSITGLFAGGAAYLSGKKVIELA